MIRRPLRFLWRSVYAAFVFGTYTEVRAQPAAIKPADNAATASSREIVVGAFSNTFPYSYQNGPSGPVEGFAVDLLDALARVMDLKIRRVVMTADEGKAQFRAGEYDMLQLLSAANGRDAWADFSIPVLDTQNTVFIRRGLHGVKKLDDLKGLSFAVAGRGSDGDVFLRSRDAAVKVTYVESPTEALTLLEKGEIDATMLSRLTVFALIEKLRLHNVLDLRDPAACIDHRSRFAVHKGDVVLLARLNEGLAILQRSGEYEKIHQKWLGRYEPAHFTREQVVSYVALALALALLVAVWAGYRQHSLRRRITGQAGELMEQGELLRALHDNVPLAMCVFDLTGEGPKLSLLNRRACEYLGISSSLSVGRLFEVLGLAPEWTTLLRTVFENACKSTDMLVEEHVIASTQRCYVVTSVSLAPRRGGFPRLCVLLEDITDRRRMDQEIAQSRRLRAVGELVGGIAHEFNNLMTPVVLKVGEVQANHPENVILQEDMAVIGTAVRRGAELTSRLLTFGRKGEKRASVEPVQSAVAVKGVLDLLRPTFDRRIVWAEAVPAGLPSVIFNVTDFNQILINLLLNARDTLMDKVALRESEGWTPRIELEVCGLPPDAFDKPSLPAGFVFDGWQRLTVRDNGMGVSPAVRERMFEPFYTTKEVGRGTGLGLAMVWHVVTSVGGHIEVDSTPGEGTAFHVSLPSGNFVGQQVAAKPIATRQPGAPLSILLVDDEKVIVDTMTAVLTREGHQVKSVMDGQQGWEYLQAHVQQHELLIIDLNMPGLDGLELVRRARKAGYAGRVLVISGRLPRSIIESMKDQGVNAVLPKPFNREELLGAVTACRNR